MMRRKRQMACFALLLSASLLVRIAWGKSTEGISHEFSAGQLALAAKVLSTLSEEDVRNGVVFSPYSLHVAMMLVRLGAVDETAQQLDTLLGLRGGIDAAAPGYQLLNREVFARGEGAQAALGNSAWFSGKISLQQSFVKAVVGALQGEVRSVDFRKPSTTGEINRWVKEVTRGLISDLFKSPIEPQTLLTLVNALYLKGAWDAPFKEKSTDSGEFWTPSGVVKRDFMHRTGDVMYYEDGAWQAVTLPLGGGRFSCSILLPRGRLTAAAVAKAVTEDLLARVESSDGYSEVDLSVPRFKVRSRPMVRKVLSELSPRVFTPEAQLSGITESPIVVSDVVHEAVVSADEQGIEAAAASAVTFVASAFFEGEKPKPVSFVADHPFAFVIRHWGTSAPLFIGVVADPQG